MVLMWIVLIGVALVAVGVLAAGLIRRPRSHDLHSVRSYHSALGTLEHMSDRVGPSTVKPLDRTDRPAEGHVADAPAGDDRAEGDGTGPGPIRAVPPVRIWGRADVPDPEAPLIFDDARPIDRYRSNPAGEGAPAVRSSRAQRMALDSMNHRPRRKTAVVLVAAVLVFFGALAYIGSRRSNTSAPPTSSTTRTTGPASTPTTAGSANRGAGGGNADKTKTKTKVTPTTLPSRIVASSSTASSATYPVGSNSFQITVTATGPCWIDASTLASGSTLWTGSLQAGSVQVIQATGPTAVQIGAASASFAVGTVPVVLPTPLHTPFVATFQPVAAASTSATTTIPAGPAATSPG
jgi:hypothetical protein